MVSARMHAARSVTWMLYRSACSISPNQSGPLCPRFVGQTPSSTPIQRSQLLQAAAVGTKGRKTTAGGISGREVPKRHEKKSLPELTAATANLASFKLLSAFFMDASRRCTRILASQHSSTTVPGTHRRGPPSDHLKASAKQTRALGRCATVLLIWAASRSLRPRIASDRWATSATATRRSTAPRGWLLPLSRCEQHWHGQWPAAKQASDEENTMPRRPPRAVLMQIERGR